MLKLTRGKSKRLKENHPESHVFVQMDLAEDFKSQTQDLSSIRLLEDNSCHNSRSGCLLQNENVTCVH